MTSMRAVLLKARAENPDLQRLAWCCGAEPLRTPPNTESPAISQVREAVAAALGVDHVSAEETHPASPWRYNLVRAILQSYEDPDYHVADWLQHGAPVGVNAVIPPCGLLPKISDDPEITVDELQTFDRRLSNHPSFSELHGQDIPPGIELIAEHLHHGLGTLYANLEAAESALQAKCHPAPLGNVAKTREDGSMKHRVIQDLTMANVNRAAVIPERQVLPRCLDHAQDVADLSNIRTAQNHKGTTRAGS